jgi:hypothetical protein
MRLTGPPDASAKRSASRAFLGPKERLPECFSSPGLGWLSVLSAPLGGSPPFWCLPRVSSYVRAMHCYRIVGAERGCCALQSKW